MTGWDGDGGRHVAIRDTRLFVAERGSGFPIIVVHGGPGLDHHEFADYLDPLGDQFQLVLMDMRSQGRSDRTSTQTWTIQRMAEDISALADALGFARYAVLGHSFGGFVALVHAADQPTGVAATVVSGGVASKNIMADVETALAAIEPAGLREQLSASWARESEVTTEDGFAEIVTEQMPFHFANPHDPRLGDYLERAGAMVYSPDMLRHFASVGYGELDAAGALAKVRHPVLVLAGRYDRVATAVAAAEAVAAADQDVIELLVLERSGHMTFVEEQEHYLEVVREFLARTCLA